MKYFLLLRMPNLAMKFTPFGRWMPKKRGSLEVTMIFAFDTEDRSLHIFPNESEAIAYCEGYDVSQVNWLFFAGDGGPLDPVFSVAASQPGFFISHGQYSLRPVIGEATRHLSNLLPSVSNVEAEPPLNTIAAVERLLTFQSSGTR